MELLDDGSSEHGKRLRQQYQHGMDQVDRAATWMALAWLSKAGLFIRHHLFLLKMNIYLQCEMDVCTPT